VRKWELLYTSSENGKIVWRCPPKLKIEVPYDVAKPLLCINPNELK
jgi:hypothetical protein